MASAPIYISALIILCILSYVGMTVLWASPEFVMPFVLSIIAGLSTTLGSLIVICRSSPLTASHLAYTCGLATGVMCFVATFDMFIPAWNDQAIGPLVATCLFTAGGITITIGLRFLPDVEHMQRLMDPTAIQSSPSQNDYRLVNVQPTEEWDIEKPMIPRSSPSVNVGTIKNKSSTLSHHDRMRTLRFGMLTAVVLGIHNLPEGLAVFVSSLESLRHGILMAIAIALHNIPEGLVIAVPTYAATGDKYKSVWWTLLSGCSEPLGALLALTLLRPYLDRVSIIMLLSFVGGIMFAVCCTELWPEGMRYGRPRHFGMGIASGICIMAMTYMMIEV